MGGNTGTTIGAQRLIAFQRAADIWGSLLDSSVEIRIQASFSALDCDAVSAILGSAGPGQMISDFPGARQSGTLYPSALANKQAGTRDPRIGVNDIQANFNMNLGAANCLAGVPWYYGLDNNHGTAIDLVHVSLGSGQETSGIPDIFERNIVDITSGKTWPEMTTVERAASVLNTRHVIWNGPAGRAAALTAIRDKAGVILKEVGLCLHERLRSRETAFGSPLTNSGLSGQVVLATDSADSVGPSTTDACSPLTNASAIAGKIALVDRGPTGGNCTFVLKARNCQSAGAIAVEAITVKLISFHQYLTHVAPKWRPWIFSNSRRVSKKPSSVSRRPRVTHRTKPAPCSKPVAEAATSPR